MKIQIPWLKVLRVGIFLLAALVTVLFLLGAWFSYQGRKDLSAALQSLREKGEPLTFAELWPQPIPPADNFFADPIWEELTDTRVNPRAPALVSPEPVLPKESRQLAMLEPKLSPELRVNLERRFPEFKETSHQLTNKKMVQEVLKPGGQVSPPTAELVLALLEPSAPLLERLRELGERPGAFYPVRYEDGISASMEHLPYLLAAAQLLSFRAEARIALGDYEQAFQDTLLILRLQETLASEPILVSLLVRASMSGLGVKVIREGIPHWNDAQLLELKSLLEEIDLTKHLVMALRGERAGINQLLDQLRGQPAYAMEAILGGPMRDSSIQSGIVQAMSYLYQSTFLDGDRAYHNQHMQKFIDALESQRPMVNPKPFEMFQTQPPQDSASLLWSVRHVLSRLTFPAMTGVLPRIAHAQNEIQQALVAIAIQRRFFAEDRMPESLDALVPDYLTTMPLDLITGKPPHYKKMDGSRYLLWSVGWNSTNEGGLLPEKPRNWSENDWVWSGSVAP